MLLRPRRRSFHAAAAVLFFATPASAFWNSSGDVSISILTPTIVFVDASEVQPGDVMHEIFVGGTGGPGEVTVVAEGSGLARKTLGAWNINDGNANVDSVFGTDAVFRVGSGTSAGATSGVLNFVNSDIALSSTLVYRGTANVGGGSKISNVEVFDESSLYVGLFSQIGNLTTRAGSLAVIREGSAAIGASSCSQAGDVLVEDSLFRCQSSSIELGGNVEVRIFSAAHSTFEITNKLRLSDGSLAVSNTIATTGLLEMGGANTDLDIVHSTWTNAGGLEFKPSAVVGPVAIDVSAGSRYHDLGTARVAGQPAYQHLTVTGAGTEFEVDGDLRIGEYVNFQGNPTAFSGNVTIADGATVVVHGALAIRPLGVLNLEPGGTIYVGSLSNAGTINENGGTLVVPEPGAIAAALAAVIALRARAAASIA